MALEASHGHWNVRGLCRARSASLWGSIPGLTKSQVRARQACALKSMAEACIARTGALAGKLGLPSVPVSKRAVNLRPVQI